MLQLIGYGAQGVTLSLVETVSAITEDCSMATQSHQLVQIGKRMPQHPVALLPGIREAVAAQWRERATA